MAARGLTRAELQRWLDEHVGERVEVALVVEGGTAFVLSASGELRHGRRDATPYEIGEVTLDVVGLDESLAGTHIDVADGVEQVEILLAEEVSLEIIRLPQTG
jgi:hypothetical protein